MSLEFTENKSNIGSGALNDLMFKLYCRVIGQQLPTRRWSVGDQLGTDWRSVGDWLATVSLAFVINCRKSVTFWRSVGDRSAISRRLKTVSELSATAATGRRSVTNQSPTSRQPVGDHQKPFYDRFSRREVSLAATKTSLRPNRPCNLLQGGRRPVASYVWPGLYVCNFQRGTVAHARGIVIVFSSLMISHTINKSLLRSSS